MDEEEEFLSMAIAENDKVKGNWFLDSGCSNHMCGDRRMFLTITEESKHSVKCGNNSRMIVAGKGSVRLVFNGSTFLIQDVYYVPDL